MIRKAQGALFKRDKENSPTCKQLGEDKGVVAFLRIRIHVIHDNRC